MRCVSSWGGLGRAHSRWSRNIRRGGEGRTAFGRDRLVVDIWLVMRFGGNGFVIDVRWVPMLLVLLLVV